VTNSGSSANLLAISALTSRKLEDNKRLKPGDEVITVAAGFPTTIYPIIQNKAIPVFVDIELDYYNIDASRLEEAISDKTKAVFLAHTLGNPFDISNVKKFCEENDLWLIEDNCDALGSLYDGKYTGTFGDISTCSFYPAHHITMGEGGALLTNNQKLNKIIRSIREWGRDCWCSPGQDNTCKKRFNWQLGELPQGYDHKYTYSEFGYNLKITDMQAAIGIAQLKKLPSFIKARQENHKRLFDGLKDFQDIIILPKAQKNSNPSWFGFLLTLRDKSKLDRTYIMRKLEEYKIQTRLLFAGNIIRQPVFDEIRENKKAYKIIGDLFNTDKAMNDSFWVGVYPGMSNEQIDYIIAQIRKVLN
ncbi:MAG: lipopolysaccharide biosynthesis protein RfbH, partial [Promethearchaeota archaeon]